MISPPPQVSEVNALPPSSRDPHISDPYTRRPNTRRQLFLRQRRVLLAQVPDPRQQLLPLDAVATVSLEQLFDVGREVIDDLGILDAVAISGLPREQAGRPPPPCGPHRQSAYRGTVESVH